MSKIAILKITNRRRPMIPRYSRPDMVSIWEAANRFHIRYLIEAHACDALAVLTS